MTSAIPCGTCDGTGLINYSRVPWVEDLHECDECHGWRQYCPECGDLCEVNDGVCCWCGEPLLEVQ